MTENYQTILDKIEADRTARQPLREKNRDTLIDALSPYGVDLVVIEFNGSGDEGQIEAPALFKADGQQVAVPPICVTLQSQYDGSSVAQEEMLQCALESFAWDALSEHYVGWQDNEGAYGQITLKVPTREAKLEFNARVIESVYSETVI